MSKKFLTGAGNRIKIFVALLPLGSREEPENINGIATTSSGIAANATVVNLGAAVGGNGIGAGTPLEFANSSGVKRKVYLTEDAMPDDTTLAIEPMTGGAIAGICTATYVAKLRLQGGTQSGSEISAERQQTQVFEDPQGFQDGVVTSQSWSLPITANLLPDDDSYRRLYYAATNAVSGREVFVWSEGPAPAGFTTGDGIKGACIVEGFTTEYPADGILSYNTNLAGQGSPILTRYA